MIASGPNLIAEGLRLGENPSLAMNLPDPDFRQMCEWGRTGTQDRGCRRAVMDIERPGSAPWSSANLPRTASPAHRRLFALLVSLRDLVPGRLLAWMPPAEPCWSLIAGIALAVVTVEAFATRAMRHALPWLGLEIRWDSLIWKVIKLALAIGALVFAMTWL